MSWKPLDAGGALDGLIGSPTIGSRLLLRSTIDLSGEDRSAAGTVWAANSTRHGAMRVLDVRPHATKTEQSKKPCVSVTMWASCAL